MINLHVGNAGRSTRTVSDHSEFYADIPESIRRLGDDEKLFRVLIELYLQDGPALLSSLRSGVDHHDPLVIEEAAHRLKGLAANFTCPRAIEAAQSVESVEDAAHSGQLDDLQVLVFRVEQDFIHLRTVLITYRDQATVTK